MADVGPTISLHNLCSISADTAQAITNLVHKDLLLSLLSILSVDQLIFSNAMHIPVLFCFVYNVAFFCSMDTLFHKFATSHRYVSRDGV